MKKEGYWVRGVDLKYPPYTETKADEFIIGDLRDPDVVSEVMFSPEQNLSLAKGLKVEVDKDKGFDEVYQLAADMGGAGFVFTPLEITVITSRSYGYKLIFLSMTWIKTTFSNGVYR